MVKPASGSAPYQVLATAGVDSCVAGSELKLWWKTSNGRGSTSLDRSGVIYYDKAGKKLDASDPTIVPKGAERVENARVLVSWSAKGWGLDDATLVTSGRCDPGKTDPSQPPAGNN